MEPPAEEPAEEARGLAPRHVAMLCQGIAAQPDRLLPDAPARLEALLPHVSAALTQEPTAVTAAQLLGSLGRCPATPARGLALDACAGQLARRMPDLQAPALVSLAVSLVPLAASSGWTPAQPMLRALSRQLDIKRYDLAPGVLRRAARALDLVAPSAVQLRLEPRDGPSAT